MSDHYAEARRLLEVGDLADFDKATVHATLYLGEQIEALAGVLAQARASAVDEQLRLEEAGL